MAQMEGTCGQEEGAGGLPALERCGGHTHSQPHPRRCGPACAGAAASWRQQRRQRQPVLPALTLVCEYWSTFTARDLSSSATPASCREGARDGSTNPLGQGQDSAVQTQCRRRMADKPVGQQPFPPALSPPDGARCCMSPPLPPPSIHASCCSAAPQCPGPAQRPPPSRCRGCWGHAP